MNAVPQQNSTTQPTAQLQKAQDLIQQLETELACMSVISREERLALPRITALNRPMIAEALINQKNGLAQTNDLALAVTYYQQLEQFHQTLAQLQEKITSSRLTLGAKIYNQSKETIQFSHQQKKNCKETLFFPLEANSNPKNLKTNRIKHKNDVIPIANIEGIGMS